jgi:hypothetical protein
MKFAVGAENMSCGKWKLKTLRGLSRHALGAPLEAVRRVLCRFAIAFDQHGAAPFALDQRCHGRAALD